MMEQRYLQSSRYHKLMILKNENIIVFQFQLFDNPSLILLFKMVINKVPNGFKIITSLLLKSLLILLRLSTKMPDLHSLKTFIFYIFRHQTFALNEISNLETKNYDGLY